jgi:hypothetical protein
MRCALAALLLLCPVGCNEVAHPADRLDCNGCHAVRYDRQADHADAGLSRACYQCHGTTQWSWAVRSHPYPIDRAPHAGWDCADCHVGGTAATLSCIQCHAHTAGRTDVLHLGVSGYAWEGRACLQCHGPGRRP